MYLCDSLQVTPDMFEFHSALCPGGYGIAGLPGSTALQCQCLEQSMEKVIHCEEDQDSIIIEVRDVTSKAFMSTYFPQLESFSESCCSTYCLQKHCYELYPYFGNVVSACLCVQGGFWVVTTPSTEAQAYLMHFYTCPAGYCRCVQNSSLNMQNCVYLYVNSNPDAQCRCNRKGKP